jgi:hypothetical protein
MVLLLATLFVVLMLVFGTALVFARPENIERPFMVGAITTSASLVSCGLMWVEWHRGTPGSAGVEIAFALLPLFAFFVGRAIDYTMGPRRESVDERQATLGAELAD